MPKVLTVDGSVKIGAYRFPDRKKPCLCVEKGNVCTVYGSFIDLDRANEFMNELAALVDAVFSLSAWWSYLVLPPVPQGGTSAQLTHE